ncbi:1-acyl-sn-glycerol-3-phosphate acyltransferase [candidate division KSB1 bacterium]|nr:1-acyl-sn-glycerol-3-phosphate acyltransferase [candidate division KSB1 bacterium]
MISTVLYVIWFVTVLLLTLVMFIPILLLQLFGLNKARNAFVNVATSCWSRSIIWMTGSRISKSGIENVPKDRAVCLIGNHQGYFDIPLVVATIPHKVGFIAKIELMRLPILNLWMWALHCIFIHRTQMHQSLRNIKRGVQDIYKGHTIVLFPEGTRSRKREMGPFRMGGLNMAIKEGVPIVPLSINGTYKIFEQDWRVHPTRVSIQVHPLIETSGLSAEEKKALPDKIRAMIESAIPEE